MAISKESFSLLGHNKTQNVDIVTPHKLSVILIIREQCLLKQKSVEEDAPPQSTLHIKGFCMLALKLIQSPDMEFNTLMDLLSGNHTTYTVSPALVKGFTDSIEKILQEGVASLVDATASAAKLFGAGAGQITKSSVLGLFLRRVLLYFDKMTFSQIVELYKQLHSYVKDPIAKDEGNMGRWSRKQAELFFAKEAARLLTEDAAPLQNQISQLLYANPDFAEAHFLSFLNCMRSRELCGAKTSLHQCFDRTSLPPDKPTPAANTNSTVTQNEDRSCRYAALTLAAMYACFGYVDEAVTSLKEAIRLAHGAGDSVCLQHSLSWLYTLSPDNKEALMERSMAKCTELGLSYLMSLGVQSYTKYCGLTGGRPSVVFDVLIRSDILNCQHMLSELAANAYCLKAGLWTLYGQANMASLCSQQLLRLNSQQPAVCMAMCTVAKTLADQGDYEHSLAILHEAQEKFPSGKESLAWMSGLQEVYFSFAANQSNHAEALSAIKLLAPMRQWESVLRKAWLLRRLGDVPGSMNLTQATLAHCRDGWYADPELPPLKVRALIAASEVLAPGEALGCLLHALALSHTYYLYHLAALITLHIADIQLSLCLPTQALRLTESSLPTILSHGSVHAKGRALVLLARCHLAVTSPSRVRTLRQTVPVLNFAHDMLLKAQDFLRVKQCYYLKALVYHEIGMTTERNKCAFEFRQLDDNYPSLASFAATF